MCECMRRVMGSVGTGTGWGWYNRVHWAMGSGALLWWEWTCEGGLYTLGADVSTLGVGVVSSGISTLGYCAATGGWQDLRRFPCFPSLGVALWVFWWMGCVGTMLNWEGLDHHWKRSQSSVIASNCASQATVGASFRAQESVFILWSILSECVRVGWAR